MPTNDALERGYRQAFRVALRPARSGPEVMMANAFRIFGGLFWRSQQSLAQATYSA